MTINHVYGGKNREPGITTTVETFENEFMFGSYPIQQMSGLRIDASARDVGNTGTTKVLRAGLLMGQNFTTKNLLPWNPDALDGTEYIWGILQESQSVRDALNDEAARLSGFIVIGGGVLSNRLIIPGQTDLGLSQNAALEYVARAQLRANFILNDSYMHSRNSDPIIKTVPDAGLVLDYEDSHSYFIYSGAEENVTVTLPATPYRGIIYKGAAPSGEFTFSSGSANIRVPGVALANSYQLSTANSRVVQIIGTGTEWLVETMN